MRVITEHEGLRVSVTEPGDGPMAELMQEYRVSLSETQIVIVFNRNTETETKLGGIAEEAIAAVLLDRVCQLVKQLPCDDFNRAFYHLVKAQECLQHHFEHLHCS